MLDAVAGKLPGLCLGKDEVTLQTSVDNLDDDIAVGDANDEAVLGGVAINSYKPKSSRNL